MCLLVLYWGFPCGHGVYVSSEKCANPPCWKSEYQAYSFLFPDDFAFPELKGKHHTLHWPAIIGGPFCGTLFVRMCRGDDGTIAESQRRKFGVCAKCLEECLWDVHWQRVCKGERKGASFIQPETLDTLNMMDWVEESASGG